MEHDHYAHSPTRYHAEYAKFALLILGVGLVALLLTLGTFNIGALMRNFMGLMFLVFAVLKFLDLPGFVAGFRGYDLIAKRISAYGYLYPLFELALAYLFLFNLSPLTRNVFTVLLQAVGAIGIYLHMHDGNEIRCVCFGSFIKLPLNYISLSENVIMGGMAAAMIFVG